MKLRKWVKYLLLVLVLFGLVKINSYLEKDFVNFCMEQGYSENYCVSHS